MHLKATIKIGNDSANTYLKIIGISCYIFRQIANSFHYICLISFLLSFFAITEAYSDNYADTVRSIVGDRVCLSYKIENLDEIISDKVEIKGRITLSNASLFLPMELRVPNYDVIRYNINKLIDSIYLFRIEFNNSANPLRSIDLHVCGECLAGSDTLSAVVIDQIIVNGQELLPLGILLIVDLKSPYPYIRFARLENNYPNPVLKNQETIWNFKIDKPSDVKFKIYTAEGQFLMERSLGAMDRGSHYIAFIPDSRIASGMYLFFLETTSGKAFKRFIIIDN